MRLNDMVGHGLTGIHWSDEGLRVSCVKEELDGGDAIFGGAFFIKFIDTAWVSADLGAVYAVITRIEESDPEPALLSAIEENTSENDRAAMRMYRFYGPDQSAPHLCVLAEGGFRIEEVPARGW